MSTSDSLRTLPICSVSSRARASARSRTFAARKTQDGSPLGDGHARPRAFVEGASGSLSGGFGILAVALGDESHRRFCGGVDNGDGGAIARGDPLAIYEHLELIDHRRSLVAGRFTHGVSLS